MTISVENRFKGYVAAFQIQDENPDQFVVSSNLKISKKVTNIKGAPQDFKERSNFDNRADTAPPVVITTLAEEILKVASGSSKNLITNISRETREKLYTILTVHQKKFQVMGIDYSSNKNNAIADASINNGTIDKARKLLKECGRISSLNHVKLTCSQLVVTEASTREQMQFHLEFHNLQIKILNQLLPICLQMGIEKKTLYHIASANLFKIGYSWYFAPAATRDLRGFLSLGNIDIHEKGSIKKLNTLLEKIAKKIILEVSTDEEPRVSAKNICDAISRHLQADVKQGFIESSDIAKLNSLLSIYCLAIETTIRRNSITREAFDQLRQNIDKMSELIKNSPFSYHKKKGLELVATAEFIENIFSPYLDDQAPIVNRSVDEVSKMVWRTSVFQSLYRDSSVKYLTREEKDQKIVQNARRFFLEARLDFFNPGAYQPTVFSEVAFGSIGKESVKDLYRECYENLQKQIGAPLDEQYMSPDDFIIKMDRIINRFNHINVICSGVAKICGSVVVEPLLNKKNNLSEDVVHPKTKKQKNQVTSSPSAPAVDEAVHAPTVVPSVEASLEQKPADVVHPKTKKQKNQVSSLIPAPAVHAPAVVPVEAPLIHKQVQEVATTPTEKIAKGARIHIKYHPRVTRWFHQGENVLDHDLNYSNLPPQERAFKVFQHAFPRQVDERISTLFTSFSWFTSSGKCILYTAPATVQFEGDVYNGFVEYAFSEDKKNCFHRYFAEEKNSLAHQLARNSYLKMVPPAVQESDLGVWEMQNSNITIVENKENVTFLEPKTGNSIAIKRKVS